VSSDTCERMHRLHAKIRIDSRANGVKTECCFQPPLTTGCPKMVVHTLRPERASRPAVAAGTVLGYVYDIPVMAVADSLRALICPASLIPVDASEIFGFFARAGPRWRQPISPALRLTAPRLDEPGHAGVVARLLPCRARSPTRPILNSRSALSGCRHRQTMPPPEAVISASKSLTGRKVFRGVF